MATDEQESAQSVVGDPLTDDLELEATEAAQVTGGYTCPYCKHTHSINGTHYCLPQCYGMAYQPIY
jgi:hypothetical protein